MLKHLTLGITFIGILTACAPMVMISEGQIATAHRTMFQDTAVPSGATLIQVVIDFGVGGTVAEHTHTGDEFVTVINGELTFTLNGAAQVVPTGGTVRVPAGTRIAVKNNGRAPARMLVILVEPRPAATN